MTQTTPLYIFVDESGTDSGSKVLCMTLVATENPDKIRKEFVGLIDEIRRDPEMSNNIKSLREKGIEHFHYTSDDHEVKTKVVNLLPSLDFDAYVIFARKAEIENIQTPDLLLRFFSTLLYPRMQENCHRDIYIVYERFNEGAASEEAAYRAIAEDTSRRVALESSKKVGTLEISFNNKTELCLGVSDYICGITSAYLNAKKDSFEERRFNRISGKIRLVHDFTRSKYYSRQGDLLDIETL